MRLKPSGLVRCSSGVARVMAGFACALLAALAVVQPIAGSDSWAKLHRPLHLPRLARGARCPVSPVDRRVDWKRIKFPGSPGIGRGPVYPGLGYHRGRLDAVPDRQYGGRWAGQKVFWYVASSYPGPVLLRGRRLDGPQLLGFNGRKQPATELRIERDDTVSWQGQPAGSRGIPSGVRARADGCYGVQIDGTTFSRVVVFNVEIA